MRKQKDSVRFRFNQPRFACYFGNIRQRKAFWGDWPVDSQLLGGGYRVICSVSWVTNIVGD